MEMKKITISHPTGNENVRHAVYGLLNADLLDSFHTCVACFKNDLLYRLSSISFLSEFRRRMFDKKIKEYTHSYPVKELTRILKRKAGKSGSKDVDDVYHDLDYKVSKYIRHNAKRIKAIYAYDEGAYYSFLQAKEEGILCFFDLPIIHWRTYQKLLQDEGKKNPEWESLLGVFSDSREKLLRKDKELLMADYIFVASSFTKQSIQEDFPHKLKAPIIVIPYGFPEINNNREYTSTGNRKLNFLYVGRLSQSKGLSYLFESVAPFSDNINLTIVGSGNIENCAILKKQLQNHTYIPYLPHHKVLALMAESDIFIFPSLFEGFGMVITEAMSQGTPVITTNRTCGIDFIKHNINGWIVEAGNTDSLKNCIANIVKHPDTIQTVGQNALNTAALYPWKKYEQKLAKTVQSLL